MIYIALVVIGVALAVSREGVSNSLIANTAWAVVNIVAFIPFIMAAAPDVKSKIRTFKDSHDMFLSRKSPQKSEVAKENV